MGPVPLTGFAHGASGFGLALFEAHAATGRTDFLEGGRAAFAYEDSRSMRSKKTGRICGLTGLPTSAVRLRPNAVTWCHGAAGIALARLGPRTCEPGLHETHVAVAKSALTTTRKGIENTRQLARHDGPLCHGLDRPAGSPLDAVHLER